VSDRTRPWVRSAVAVVLVAASAGLAVGGPGPRPASARPVQAAPDDAFFTPPAPLPAGSPGDVMRSRPSPAGPRSTRALADAWQVMYLSTDVAGAPNAVTGTILVPKDADPATAPIVGFGPGTHGPAFRCAPSLMLADGGFYEQPAVDDMLERGYAVAVTDYEGYHPDPATTYMTGRSMGHALLDAVRAAQRLPEAGLAADTPVVLRGYSQGGGAAMWAGQQHPSYAPELDLVGVAGGGVPADLVQVGIPLDGADGFGFFLYTLLGIDNAYADVSLEPHLNDAGRAAIARMEDDVCVLELILELGGGTIAGHTVSSPLTAALLGHIVENGLGGQAIDVPVFQYHEQQDGLVAFGQAQALRDAYCSLGVQHTWRTYDTGGATGLIRHVNLVYRANDDVNRFVESRLAGAPATSTC